MLIPDQTINQILSRAADNKIYSVYTPALLVVFICDLYHRYICPHQLLDHRPSIFLWHQLHICYLIATKFEIQELIFSQLKHSESWPESANWVTRIPILWGEGKLQFITGTIIRTERTEHDSPDSLTGVQWTLKCNCWTGGHSCIFSTATLNSFEKHCLMVWLQLGMSRLTMTVGYGMVCC